MTHTLVEPPRSDKNIYSSLPVSSDLPSMILVTYGQPGTKMLNGKFQKETVHDF